MFVSFRAVIVIPSRSEEFYYTYDKRALFVVCFQFVVKAMLHEATKVALQVARKTSRVTPHFATAIVALRVARKVERPSPFRNVARQVACV